MKTVRVVAAVIKSTNKNGAPIIFATQRGYGDLKGGWEFPGGKIEEGETPQEALRREILEELETEIAVGDLITTIEYDYPTFHLSMDCFWAEVVSGDLVLKEHEAARWLTMDELDSVEWLPADITLIEEMKRSYFALNRSKEKDKKNGEDMDENIEKIKSLTSFFKSIVDQDTSAVVICNTEHEIIYMNPVAISAYEKWGGAGLAGKSLMECHNRESGEKIRQVVDWFAADESHNIVYTFYNEKQNKDVYMVALREEGRLIGYYEKHEYRNKETMKKYDLW